FNVNRLDGSFHVAGIDSGTNHQRSFADVRVERVEGGIAHPLPLADIVSQASSKSELPEDVIQHPVRVIARVETADGGESVCNLTLRLARHHDLTHATTRLHCRRRHYRLAFRRAVPPIEQIGDPV